MSEMRTIKAITLHQPWASLIAIGAKEYETRSWGTSYRGYIAIHAGKTVAETWQIGRQFRQEFAALNLDWEIDHHLQVPTGAVVAIAWLDASLPVSFLPSLTTRERAFGDFRPGRHAWRMINVKKLAQPIPARGQQGLWDWTVPDGLVLP